jgi:hypothetical protein
MRPEWEENSLRNAIARVSERNRVTPSRYINLKRGHGLKVGTLANYVYCLRKLETHVEGKRFEEMVPEDVGSFLAGLHRSHPAGRHPRGQDAVGHIRPFLKSLLQSDPLPPAWEVALKQRWSYQVPKVAVAHPRRSRPQPAGNVSDACRGILRRLIVQGLPRRQEGFTRPEETAQVSRIELPNDDLLGPDSGYPEAVPRLFQGGREAEFLTAAARSRIGVD